DVVSLYIDHVLESDIGVGLARECGVPIYPSIRRALYCGPGKELAVDGVLLIGEHGDYPWNERGRHMYPRRYFYEQIAGVFGECGRSVPVFNDKHFAYDFADARWMWDRAAELRIPLMAGSCLPLAWRRPWLEYDLETPVEEAVAVGYGDGEAYGYHTIETLQCMVERRVGGETGVASVQCLVGDEVWRSRDRGEWSGELGEAACAAIENKPAGSMEEYASKPAVFLIRYRDGLRAAALMLDGYIKDWSYAGRVAGRPEVQGNHAGNGDRQGAIAASGVDRLPVVHATEFFLQPDGPGASFGYLSRNIQEFFRTGVAPYPPERTLLTTGITDAMMISRHEAHRVVPTPYLDIAYRSYTALPLRPRGPRPSGACLDRTAPDLLLPWRT
ncbi:MAG: hypothetical protein ABIL09_13370, partial [Gemmatimonadota bacterium]